jgi:hypothetical protein
MSLYGFNQHPNRESWFGDVADRLRPAFQQLDAPLPSGCALPSASPPRDAAPRPPVNARTAPPAVMAPSRSWSVPILSRWRARSPCLLPPPSSAS